MKLDTKTPDSQALFDLMGRILEQPTAKDLADEVARQGGSQRRHLVASLAVAQRDAASARAEVGKLTRATEARVGAAEQGLVAAREAHVRAQWTESVRVMDADERVRRLMADLDASADPRISALVSAITGASGDLMGASVHSVESRVSPEGGYLVDGWINYSNAATRQAELERLSECRAEAEALLYSDLDSKQMEQALYRIARKAGVMPPEADSGEPWYRRALRTLRGQRA
jgi:hypothetical protein